MKKVELLQSKEKILKVLRNDLKQIFQMVAGANVHETVGDILAFQGGGIDRSKKVPMKISKKLLDRLTDRTTKGVLSSRFLWAFDINLGYVHKNMMDDVNKISERHVIKALDSLPSIKCELGT